MTLCPYALIKSCKECPIVEACPLKRVIGDYQAPIPEPLSPEEKVGTEKKGEK